MTAKSKDQVFVDSEKEILEFFKESNFVDCRINGYSAHN